MKATLCFLLILFAITFLDIHLNIKYEIFIENPNELESYKRIFILFRFLSCVSVLFFIFSFFIKRLFVLKLIFALGVMFFSLGYFFILSDYFENIENVYIVLYIFSEYVLLFIISATLSWFHLKSLQKLRTCKSVNH